MVAMSKGVAELALGDGGAGAADNQQRFGARSGAERRGLPQRPRALHAEIRAAVRPELPTAKRGSCCAQVQSRAPTAGLGVGVDSVEEDAAWPLAIRASTRAGAVPEFRIGMSMRPMLVAFVRRGAGAGRPRAWA